MRNIYGSQSVLVVVDVVAVAMLLPVTTVKQKRDTSAEGLESDDWSWEKGNGKYITLFCREQTTVS